MVSSTKDPEIVRVSQKGQATIPKSLRDKFDIDAPGEVFIYESDGQIVITPVPSLEELHGRHAGDHEPGDIAAKVRETKATERERERDRLNRLRPEGDE